MKKIAALALLPTALVGCTAEESKPAQDDRPTISVGPQTLDPDDFVDGINHPYLPLKPGSVWEYEVTGSEGDATVTVTVLQKTKDIGGISATVVHDQSVEDGEVAEDTYDWFAQDKAGNVWYLGEKTVSYEDGKAIPDGSFEAGVDGARAGIAMPAHPEVGDRYYIEYAKGEAEDHARILATNESIEGPTGHYVGVLKTADGSSLEPEVTEHKFYALGVGVVYEEYVSGGDEEVTLVEFTRP